MMKKYISLYNAGRVIVFFEIVLCAVATLSLLMVNGTGELTTDHLSLLLLVGITTASTVLLKASKPGYQKTVLWMAVLPLLFVSYETIAAFVIPYQV
jgi:hypothetical protein